LGIFKHAVLIKSAQILDIIFVVSLILLILTTVPSATAPATEYTPVTQAGNPI